jgi:hypothetical protein
MNGIVEINGCYFLKDQLDSAHGHDNLDLIGQEAFVNHLHVDGKDHETDSRKILDSWLIWMAMFPGQKFRIYIQTDDKETTLRFHAIRNGISNWYDGDELKIIET